MNRALGGGEWRTPIDLAQEKEFALGALAFRPSLCEVSVGERTESVEPRVMQALVALVQQRGSVLSRDELVERCWGRRAVSDDAINRCIAKVRKLAELDCGASFSVETVPRVGYRLVAHQTAATRVAADPPARPAPDFSARRIVPWFALAGVAVLALVFVASRYILPASSIASVGSAHAHTNPGGPTLAAGTVFRDCPDVCPEMVAIPKGHFLMGSSFDTPGRNDDEIPQHSVSVPAFAMSRYPVTREEYLQFVNDTGRPDGEDVCFTVDRNGLMIETPKANWRSPGFPQTPRDPVVCVNWEDAEAYADWLSRKTGKPYRVPTESEFEYAARAGDEGIQPQGKLCSLINGADRDYHARIPGDSHYDPDCRDSYPFTSPVGSFPPNAFGLFDMQGNVAQWVADCYFGSYDGAPTDGSAWVSQNCSRRLAKGQGWVVDTRGIRFARRSSTIGIGRFNANGFRIARSY